MIKKIKKKLKWFSKFQPVLKPLILPKSFVSVAYNSLAERKSRLISENSKAIILITIITFFAFDGISVNGPELESRLSKAVYLAIIRLISQKRSKRYFVLVKITSKLKSKPKRLKPILD